MAYALSEEEVARLEARRRQAMLDADVAALDALLAEELVWVHGSSKRDDKRSLLDGFARGSLVCHRLDDREQTIRVYGNAALVTGVQDVEVGIGGARRSQSNVYAALWVAGAGATRLVHWQSTRCVPPA